jgi:hypothetical protein
MKKKKTPRNEKLVWKTCHRFRDSMAIHKCIADKSIITKYPKCLVCGKQIHG